MQSPATSERLSVSQNAVIDVIPGAGTPDAIAKIAIAEATARGVIGRGRKKLAWYERTDEVWAVFDRDEHHHYDDAIRLCEETQICVGRSNPCFEVWLILHFQDFHKPDGREAVLAHLCEVCPSYKLGKGREADFDKIIMKLETAEQRAERQLAKRKDEGSEFGPPSTTVFRLTRSVWKKRK
jgi:RloB-like protein